MGTKVKKKYPISVQCLFAWLVLMPFSFVPIGNFGSILKFLTIGIVLYYFLKGGRLIYRRSSVLTVWALYVFYCAISVIWSVDLPAALTYIVGYIQFIAIAFLFSSEKINDDDLRHLENGWIFIALFCIIVFLGGSGKVINWGGRSTMYMLGAYTDPNEFGGYFCIPVGLMCRRLFSGKIWSRILYLIIIFLSIYIVLKTGSRGALIALILSICIALVQGAKFSIKNIVLILIIIFASYLILSNFILPQISESVLSRLSLSSIKADEGSERSLIWAEAIAHYSDTSIFRKFFGFGIFGGIFSSIDTTMHNQLLQNLIDGGIIGLVLYTTLIMLVFQKFNKQFNNFIPGYLGMMFLSMTLTMTASYKPLWTLMIFGLMYRRGTKYE